MKKILFAAVLAVVAVFVAVPAATSANDTKGPPCSNIVGADLFYNGTEGAAASFTGTVDLGKQACSAITYSLTVTDTSGTILASTSTPDTTGCTPLTSGDGCFGVDLSILNAPHTVCVYATTSRGDRITDYAPDFQDPLCPQPSASIGINGSGASGNFG